MKLLAGGVLALSCTLAAAGSAGSTRAAASIVPLPPVPAIGSGLVVTGNATVSVAPDLAQLVVSIQTTAATASQAQTDNATIAARVRSRAESAGIAAADIKTLSFQVWPQYDYRSGGQPVLTGFAASHTLQLSVRDTRLIGRVIDAAIAGGATSVQGISYEASNRTANEAAALSRAVKDAHAKAAAMAEAAGVGLGRVISITDSYEYSP